MSHEFSVERATIICVANTGHVRRSYERMVARMTFPVLISYDVSCQFFHRLSSNTLPRAEATLYRRHHDRYLRHYLRRRVLE